MKFSIINYKYVSDYSGFRFDSEFYKKQYLDYENKVLGKGNQSIRGVLDVLTDYTSNGSFASLKSNVELYDSPKYAKWIRIHNLDLNDFSNDVRWVDKKGYDFLKKSSLHGNEILLSKTGEYLGKAYIFPQINELATLADNIFLIKLKKNFSFKTFVIYINSKIGQSFILRYSQGTGQPTIIKDSLREIPYPDFSDKFQSSLEAMYDKYSKLFTESDSYYKKAESILLTSVGLQSWKPTHVLNFTKKFKFVYNTDRFDAEYFQPKYEEIFNAITKNNYLKLNEIATITKSKEVGSDAYVNEGIPFVRVSNISKYGISDTNQQYIPVELYDKYKTLQPKKGEILLTKDATPGVAFYLNQEPEKMILSGGVLRLNIKNKDVSPEYLELTLNSLIVQQQLQRDAGGSVIVHWLTDQIKNTVIPMIEPSLREEITKLMIQAHEKRDASNTFLSLLKRVVETTVEEDEEKALRLLESNAN